MKGLKVARRERSAQSFPRALRATRDILLATASCSLRSWPPTFSSHQRSCFCRTGVSDEVATLFKTKPLSEDQKRGEKATYIPRSSSASRSSGLVRREPMPSCCNRTSSGMSLFKCRSRRDRRTNGGPKVDKDSTLKCMSTNSPRYVKMEAGTVRTHTRPLPHS